MNNRFGLKDFIQIVLLGAIPTIALALAAAVVFEAATSLAKGRAG